MLATHSGFALAPSPARPARMMPEGESNLIRRAQAGDVACFNQLVRAYQTQVYHTAMRVLGDSEAAADATQEAFISAFKHIKSFRGDSFRGWLMRIVTNACYDILRERQRHPRTSLESPSGDERRWGKMDYAAPETPQDAAEREEIVNAIQAALQTLPIEQRVTLVLFDVQGFGYEEIARITDTNIGTVKSRISRARAAVREQLLARGLRPSSANYA